MPLLARTEAGKSLRVAVHAQSFGWTGVLRPRRAARCRASCRNYLTVRADQRPGLRGDLLAIVAVSDEVPGRLDAERSREVRAAKLISRSCPG